jgi:sugar transferase (PEP-CTERM/EpsH1 system associated)
LIETDRRIHIVHVQESLEVGGLENGVVNIANGLDPSRFRTTICCLNRLGPLTSRLDNSKVRYLCLNEKAGKRLMLFFRLQRLFTHICADIVHTHNYYSGVYGIIGAKLSKHAKIIHGEHGNPTFSSAIQKTAVRNIYPMAHTVVTVSSELGRALAGQGVPATKIKCILNGVDTRRFKPAASDMKTSKRQALGVEESDILFGYVGRISAEKGVDRLLYAFSKLNKSYRNVRLAIAGDGPIFGAIKILADKLDIGASVIFLGSRDDVHEVYSCFDVFILPSLVEGLSNVILEAMASGLAIVATDVGGNSELITHRESGIIVAPDSVEQLHQAMETLVEDRKQRESLASAALSRAHSGFSLNRMIHQYSDLYESLANGKAV